MSGFDLPDGTRKIFFALGLDDPNQFDSVQQIRFCAHGICASPTPVRQAATRKNSTDLRVVGQISAASFSGGETYSLTFTV